MSLQTFQQYNIVPWLTPVRLVSSSNIAGTYFNGTSNNGVGATLTIAASSLTVDSVVANVSDRILLTAQSSGFQNGIYVVNSISSTVVLQRAADQQSIEQYKEGQYVSVGAGTALGGSAFVLVEPLPAALGINTLSWVDASSSANIALPTIANHIATYTNTSGALGEDAATAINGGNIQAGLSGTAGTLISFPATAANGSLIIQAVNAGGAFNTTIASGTMGQSTVYTIPDIGATTGDIVVSTAAVRMKSVAAAAAAGGAAAQSFTDAFCTSGSVVIGNWVTQANAASVLKIVPGNGSFVVTSSADAGVGTFSYIINK